MTWLWNTGAEPSSSCCTTWNVSFSMAFTMSSVTNSLPRLIAPTPILCENLRFTNFWKSAILPLSTILSFSGLAYTRTRTIAMRYFKLLVFPYMWFLSLVWWLHQWIWSRDFRHNSQRYGQIVLKIPWSVLMTSSSVFHISFGYQPQKLWSQLLCEYLTPAKLIFSFSNKNK